MEASASLTALLSAMVMDGGNCSVSITVGQDDEKGKKGKWRDRSMTHKMVG